MKILNKTFLIRFLVVLITTSPVVQATIPLSEREALLEMAAANTSLSDWTGVSGTECGWSGVTCNSGQTNVISLIISYSRNITTLPAEIGQLSALIELDLIGNQLSSLPPEIGQLSMLTSLKLQNNQLSSLPTEIGQLSALEYLNLSNNKLSIFLTEIGQLSALIYLDLSNNQLSSLPAEIGQLSVLNVLSLNNNQLSSLPTAFVQLNALSILDLSGNQLNNFSFDIGQLSTLTSLSLSDNQFTSFPTEIGQLIGLTSLNFSGNQLSSFPLEIVQLSALEYLFLSGNQLSSLPAELGQLSALIDLGLSYNQLNSLPAEIGQLSALTRLDLENNQLISLPSEIELLSALTSLSLISNQLNSLPPEIWQLSALTRLYLDGNRLSSLPAELGQLSALIDLGLSYNQLSSLPAEIGQLSALIGLGLNNNQLNSLPAEIWQLSTLTYLALNNNLLSSVSTEIGQLSALKSLNLSSNQLNSLPPEMGLLSGLTSLSLMGNKLSSLPAQIWQLLALIDLDISHNQLSSLPPQIEQLSQLQVLRLSNNQLSSLPTEIGQLNVLTSLFLDNNQLTTLPAEITQLTGLPETSLTNDINNNCIIANSLPSGVFAFLERIYSNWKSAQPENCSVISFNSTSVIGQTSLVSVTLNSSFGTPTGQIDIKEGENTLCTAQLNAGNGACTFSYPDEICNNLLDDDNDSQIDEAECSSVSTSKILKAVYPGDSQFKPNKLGRLDKVLAPDADEDSDGLSNLQEYNIGTDPFKDDTDNDGLLDNEDIYPLDRYESNDIFFNATPITVNDTNPQKHYINNNNGDSDIDWLVFYAEAGKPYDIQILNGTVGGDIDPVISLYKQDGTIEMSGLDLNNAGEGEQLDFIPGTSGFYYIRIHDKASSTGIDRGYQIRVFLGQAPQIGLIEGKIIRDCPGQEIIENARIMIGNSDYISYLDGSYSTIVNPGTYDLTISKAGYNNKTITGVLVTENAIIQLDIKLVPTAGCNTIPVDSITIDTIQSVDTIGSVQTVNLQGQASDTVGHFLSYSWRANCPINDQGSFSDRHLQNSQWLAPLNDTNKLQKCTLTVTVEDQHGESEQTSKMISVQVADSDGDGLPDWWEIKYNIDNANGNNDNDGLTNLQEFEAGTDPKERDTDGDGIADHIDPFPLIPDDEICIPIKTPDSKIVMICF